ncbi:MAG: hypothetical protein M0026_07970 [Nocardiopsaceae bacterium]|nr:hypothetical protein [Nocardiopsaceae bacterium]
MAPLNRISLWRVAAGTTAVGATLALSACGGPDMEELRTGPVPDEAPELDESELPREPADDAPLSHSIEWNLVKEVNTYARAFDPESKADCPDADGTQDTEITCTVVYHGVEAEWDVSISEHGFVASYEMEPAQGKHIARDVAEDVVRADTGAEAVRCDMDEVVLVDLETPEEEWATCVWATEDDHGTYVIMPKGTHEFGAQGFWAVPKE